MVISHAAYVVVETGVLIFIAVVLQGDAIQSADVRNLAQRSAAAAKNISALINESVVGLR
ncbi:hypothetical protein [Actimicrobium sp. CCI2.3]|uniref:hypothetical protein n=1 Tax=Actimicrobium sp. CCI2.3 TaxID=3048616 RepID=UPI002AB592B0|nr:hypothetical protein [Actimicrobium sp. CCI2.3]MDY7573159.1 hypothetical protein [Actimicrobium sp. CCI2.3]MEB0022138.1 hypothetical protein [Actimicrobium sp. CCI2.3]